MSKLMSLIRRAPKRFSAVVLMIAAAVIIPATLLAWGPDRTLYHWNQPAADHVTFNSFVDNPVQGDERNFMQIREVNASNTTYADQITLQDGHEYVMNIYYHNNAQTALNASGVGIAHGAYVKAQIPTFVPAGSTGTPANGFIGATNAQPLEVWDDVSLKNTTSSDMVLTYVNGSTTLHNFGKANGTILPDNITGATGTPIGYDAVDGNVPGCNDFSGFVTFRFKVSQPNFTLSKDVRVAGQTEFKENVTANPGDTLEYRIQYKNTGAVRQENVVVKDTLPAHVTYVPGSTVLTNNSNPNGKVVSDNLTNGTGVNIGNYSPNSAATLVFKAKVNAVTEFVCGPNTLTNTASAVTGGLSRSDTASTTVNKECAPGTITVCKLSTKQTVTITEAEYNANKSLYSKNPADCTPPELPKTGTTENIVAVVGLGALIASIAYYVASRRAVNQ